MNLYSNLTDENIELYCIRHYNNPQCISVEDYHNDMRRFKYIKRLLNQFHNHGTVKIRLLLNHVIMIYNIFDPEPATRILFFKITEQYWDVIKPLLIHLNLMPEIVQGINNRDIRSSDIQLNESIVQLLRENK